MPTKFVDPQNMYVFDKNYFANETYVVFNNSVYGLVHLSLCVMFPLLGIMVSSLTIYLSIWRNPAHFKSFSRIVLISAVVDLFYAGSDFWCQPRYQGSSSAILFSFTGPVSLLDYKVQCYSHCFKRMVQTLVFMILPAQHMLRYQILKTNSMPPLTYTLVYASICVAVSLFSFGVTAAAFCTFENPGSVDFGPLWYKENPIPVLLVASTATTPTLLYRYLSTSVVVFCFSLTAIFALLTVLQLRSQSKKMTPQMLSLQKQIGRALFVQTLVPLLTFVIPFFLPRICVYLDIKVGYLLDVNYSLMTSYPLFSSISALIFIIPYRDFCKRLVYALCFGRFDNVTASIESAPAITMTERRTRPAMIKVSS